MIQKLKDKESLSDEKAKERAAEIRGKNAAEFLGKNGTISWLRKNKENPEYRHHPLRVFAVPTGYWLDVAVCFPVDNSSCNATDGSSKTYTFQNKALWPNQCCLYNTVGVPNITLRCPNDPKTVLSEMYGSLAANPSEMEKYNITESDLFTGVASCNQTWGRFGA